MRWLNFFLVLLVVDGAAAQRPAFGVVYGNMLYRKNLLGQLNTWDQYAFGKSVQFIGFETDRIPLGARNKYNSDNFSNIQFVQFIPSAFQVNDTVSGTLSGMSFGWTYGYDVFNKMDMVDLMFSGGLNLGRMKLVQNDLDFLDKSTNNLHLKNMFISPKAQVMLKFSLPKINLSFCGEYLYDISESGWKEKLLSRNKPASANVATFNQTGLSFSISLGIAIFPSDEPYEPEDDEDD